MNIAKNKKIWLISIISLITLAIFGTVFYFALNKKSSNKEFSVAYSTDQNYIYPTIVSMTSLMENTSQKNYCKFTILTSGEFSDEDAKKIKTVENAYSNCSVNFVNMGEKFGNSEVSWWSKAMYYRLNLPEILPNEKRCVYLDGDTMVRGDISYMFDVDMNDYYIAGVHDMNDLITPTGDYYETLGIPSLDTYICSGVLIMNLEKMRNENMGKTLTDLIEENDIKKNFSFPDQDALNKACYGHILLLPFKYGALAHIDATQDYSDSSYARWVSSPKDWDEGRKNPTVVHFAGVKPWKKILTDLGNEWWNYSRKTAFASEIAQKYPLD